MMVDPFYQEKERKSWRDGAGRKRGGQAWRELVAYAMNVQCCSCVMNLRSNTVYRETPKFLTQAFNNKS